MTILGGVYNKTEDAFQNSILPYLSVGKRSVNCSQKNLTLLQIWV